ncbi:MAG: hypothetical protein MZV64_15475 [Ignavibacteriales bacterium]|nr:hypothetical protein [Ignavibacteriales bacterium]
MTNTMLAIHVIGGKGQAPTCGRRVIRAPFVAKRECARRFRLPCVPGVQARHGKALRGGRAGQGFPEYHPMRDQRAVPLLRDVDDPHPARHTGDNYFPCVLAGAINRFLRSSESSWRIRPSFAINLEFSSRLLVNCFQCTPSSNWKVKGRFCAPPPLLN